MYARTTLSYLRTDSSCSSVQNQCYAKPLLTCSQLDFCSRLAGDKVLEIFHGQNEGLDLSARSDTSLPTAHGAVPPCVVKQQHLPNELPWAPQRYNGP